MYLKTFKICLEKYEVNLAHFCSARGLTWQAVLKKTKVTLHLLTDIDLLLMVEKGIRGGIYHPIHRYAKVYKHMKNDDKNKESSYLNFWDVNSLYVWAMSRKLLLDGFKWVDDASQFNKDFTKKYNENSDLRYFLEVDVKHPEKLHKLHNDYLFCQNKLKLKSSKTCNQLA